MERFGKALFSMIIAMLVSSVLDARVNFGSSDSAIKLASKAHLTVSSSNLNVAGTIAKQDDSLITGNNFSFSNGILELTGKPLLLSAWYNPSLSSNTTKIQLTGAQHIFVESGVTLSRLEVSGSDNKLEGSPLFLQDIDFSNKSTSLELILHNKLNKNININHGSLYLGSNLHLLDDIFLIGPGKVLPRGRKIFLGGYYSKPWSSELDFEKATAIQLEGASLDITGKWRFSGINRINGSGGSIHFPTKDQSFFTHNFAIKSNASLYLTDITLKDLGNNQIWLGSDGSLHLSHVTIELREDVTFDKGMIVIDGPTTFILNNKRCTFTGKSKLQVFDRLYLDTQGGSSGDIIVSNGVSIRSVASSTGGNHIIDSSAAVIALTDEADSVAPAARRSGHSNGSLIGAENLGRIAHDITLRASSGIPVGGSIICYDDLTIDGNGCSLVFNPHKSKQLVVEPGVTVTLQNITLSRLSSQALMLQETVDPMTHEVTKQGRIFIGENVTFELEQDFFLKQGLLRVLSGRRGNILTLRGCSGKRKVMLHPDHKALKRTSLLDLGESSLKLENIELVGLGSIACNSSKGSSVVLAGGAVVNAVATQGDPNDPILPYNFDIEGVNNEIIVRQDGLRFSGGISFLGTAAANVLRMRCAPLYLLPSSHPLKENVEAGCPLIRFAGNPGIYLASHNSFAGIEFVDKNVSLQLEHPHAFIIDEPRGNSSGALQLKANHIHVWGDSIKQLASNVSVNIRSLCGLISTNPDTVDRQGKHAFHLPKTAFTKSLKKQHQLLGDYFNLLKKGKLVEGKKKPKKTKHSWKQLPVRCEVAQEFFEDGILRKIQQRKKRVLFDSLASYSRLIDYNVDLNGESLEGDIAIKNAQLKNVVLGTSKPSILLLGGNARIALYHDTPSAVLSRDSINVEGRGNVIDVAGSLLISSALKLDTDAELTINFVDLVGNKPTVRFDANSLLHIPEGATIKFTGNGTVELGDNVHVIMHGQYLEQKQAVAGSVLQLEKGATLSVQGRSQLRGVGIFNIFHGSHLCIGDIGKKGNAPKFEVAPAEDDCIACNIDRSEIIIGGQNAMLATGKGTTFWQLSSKSLLTVANGSKLALNIDDTKGKSRLQRGYVAQFSLSGGAGLYVAHGGAIWLAPNKPTSRLRRELALQLFADPASWLGEGDILHYSSDSKLHSRSSLQASSGVHIAEKQLTMKRFAAILQGSF